MWHMFEHLKFEIEHMAPYMGLIFYLLMAAGQGFFPIYINYTYPLKSGSTYWTSGQDTTAVTKFEWAWYVIWISSIVIGGATFITSFIALFQVLGEINMLIWGVFQVILGLGSIVTAVVFLLLSLQEAQTVIDSATASADQKTKATFTKGEIRWFLTAYLGTEALVFATLYGFRDSWVAGNMLSLMKM